MLVTGGGDDQGKWLAQPPKGSSTLAVVAPVRMAAVLPPTTPVSVVITMRQLEWLDQLRSQGAISRSAVLRVVLDRVIEQEQFHSAIARPTDGR